MDPSMSRVRLIATTLWALAACLLVAAPAVQASGGSLERVGRSPGMPRGAVVVGDVQPEQELQLYVALQPPEPEALERFASEVSTPGSPLYGQYLSVPEFAQRFGAPPEEVAAVRSALARRGLEVGAPAANRLSLPVTATVAAAESAFGVSLDQVRLSSGRLAYANDRAPALSAAAAPYVQGVLGLDDLARSQRRGSADAETAAPPATTATTGLPTPGPQPCAAALQGQAEEGGYTADQIAAAYGLSNFHAAGNFGAGQTVALLELEPYSPADIATYQSCYGTAVEITNVDVNGGPGPYKGEDGESALDLEQLIGLAPGADIVVYQAPNTGAAEVEILSSYVQQNVAKVMSSSWGICEPAVENGPAAAMDALLQEAAAQGQSFFVAAGDYGSTDCYEEDGIHDKSLAVDFPGSDPFATDVGGTRMEDPTAAPPTEYLWNDSPKWGAGGGGISEHFPMPSYQRQAAPALGVLNDLSTGDTCGFAYCRQVPDVAADASGETGYVVFSEGVWWENGGTSAVAPLWAALATLVNASPACQGHSIGFANPALYAVAGSAYAANFRDITSVKPDGMPTTNRFDAAKPFPAKAGYDMASGLGTPNGFELGASLCALAAPPAPAPPPAGGVSAAITPGTPASRPSGARVIRASIRGIAGGKPKLTLELAARAGARLRAIAITLPPGLVAAEGSGRAAKTLHARLLHPRSTASFQLAFPALAATPRLVAGVKAGRVHTRQLTIATRESHGLGSRLPVVVQLRP
jgi:subtilase family serine protease